MRMLAVLGVVLATCGVAAAAAGHSAAGNARARCPVTTRGSSRTPPYESLGSGLPVPYVRVWRGNRAIWIRLPRCGILPAVRDPHKGTISSKFPWWRVLPGNLRAWAQPVGRPGPRLRAEVMAAANYGPTGFVPSMLHFSRPGCWRITGSLRGRTLSVRDARPPGAVAR
jgi:hypothetical protein